MKSTKNCKEKKGGIRIRGGEFDQITIHVWYVYGNIIMKPVFTINKHPKRIRIDISQKIQ
jgi:hypothetical protein